jgi:hypothetical protein
MRNETLEMIVNSGGVAVNEFDGLHQKRSQYAIEKSQQIVSLIEDGFQLSDLMQYRKCSESILHHHDLVKYMVTNGVSVDAIKSIEGFNLRIKGNKLGGLQILDKIVETGIPIDLIADLLKSSNRPVKSMLRSLYDSIRFDLSEGYLKGRVNYFLSHVCEIEQQNIPEFNQINIFTMLWAMKNFNRTVDFIEFNGRDAFLNILEYRSGLLFQPQCVILNPRAFSRLKSIGLSEDVILKYGGSFSFLEHLQEIGDAEFADFINHMNEIASGFKTPDSQIPSLAQLNLAIAHRLYSPIRELIKLENPMMHKFFSSALQSFPNNFESVSYIFKRHKKLNGLLNRFEDHDINDVFKNSDNGFKATNLMIANEDKVINSIDQNKIPVSSVIRLAHNGDDFRRIIKLDIGYNDWMRRESLYQSFFNRSALGSFMNVFRFGVDDGIGGEIAKYLSNSECMTTAIANKSILKNTVFKICHEFLRNSEPAKQYVSWCERWRFSTNFGLSM